MRRLFATFFATVLVAACGARSPLFVGESNGGAAQGGGGAGPVEAGTDAAPDVPPDVPPDTQSSCVEMGVTYIYVITAQEALFRFYPPDGTFTMIGDIGCPGEGAGASPFSMGVDRTGIAWVVYEDGHLFRVSTATADCTATPYVPGQLGWKTFGMAFATTTPPTGEALFVAESDYSKVSKGLATIDLGTFDLSFIAPLTPPLSPPSFALELTGTGDGRLFGFALDNPGPGSQVAEIDKATGQVLSDVALPTVGISESSFAFAYWGGDFYLFTSDNGNAGPTVVNRYSPSDGSVLEVASLTDAVVGVGVSTCAPE